MNFTQYIREWLRAHPLISIAALENDCGIPSTTLMRDDRDIPARHRYALCWHLAAYGLTIGNWKLYQDPMGIIRHNEISCGTMTEEYRYHVVQSRSIDDVHDFNRFLESFFEVSKAGQGL